MKKKLNDAYVFNIGNDRKVEELNIVHVMIIRWNFLVDKSFFLIETFEIISKVNEQMKHEAIKMDKIQRRKEIEESSNRNQNKRIRNKLSMSLKNTFKELRHEATE